LSITTMPKIIIALVIALLVAYIALGGSARIMKASEKIIPIKVGLFFIATGTVLILHYQSIIPALLIIVKSGLNINAFASALLGISIQNALCQGLTKSLNATEVGLGTAGILFGATSQGDAVKNGIMSMLIAFISNYCVCFLVMLMFVATGTWTSGLASTALVSQTYSTTFGGLGCWISALLSIFFGLGVLVAYTFIGQQCWNVLTRGRFTYGFVILFCLAAFTGPLISISLVFNPIDIVNAGLIILNLSGLLYLLPKIAKETYTWEKQNNNQK
jgi:alanine or glycine:cation symporter, AGCS family